MVSDNLSKLTFAVRNLVLNDGESVCVTQVG